MKFTLAAILVAGTYLTTSAVLQAQSAGTMPETPQARDAGSAPRATSTAQGGSGVLSGTLLDTNHGVLEGVRVMLRCGNMTRTAITGSGGQFTFEGLPPGPCKLTATDTDMSAYASESIDVPAGGNIIVPAIVLSVTSASSVTVHGDKVELSVEQVQIAEQQRVFGVVPNFYSAYDWNAPPMLAKQKFQLSLRSLFDPVSFLEVAGIAGAEQYQNVFPAYGGGLEGYGKRFGAAFANHASGDILGRAVYPAIFHQDPRYFYKGSGSIKSRALYAMSAAVIARNDDGRWRPNYSAVLGNLSAGAISNLYYPASDRGASLVFVNGLAETGADAVGNLIREFVLKDITSRARGSRSGKP